MNKMEMQRRILIIVVGLVLLSVLLMTGTLPGIIQDTSPGSNPRSAAIGTFVVMILHLVIVYGYFTSIRAYKQGRSADKGLNIGLGILLLIFCLVIMDGASAFLGHVLFVSILFFIAAFCDLAAAIIAFAALFMKPKKNGQTDL
jgi:hypothetical protein